MKNYAYISGLVIFLLLAGAISNIHTDLPGREEMLAVLEKEVKVINRISGPDTSYEDLEFLGEIIKNRDIVMLGEMLHGNGSDFLAKSRLVKYLHEKCGFDVLIYEAGFYDTYNMWNNLKEGNDHSSEVFLKALYPFWCSNHETIDLMNYIVSNVNTEDELTVAGLDIQFSGRVNYTVRDSLLSVWLAANPEIDSSAFPVFFSIKREYPQYVYPYAFNRLSEGMKDSILAEIKLIGDLIEEKPEKTGSDSLYMRFFRNMSDLYTYTWKHSWLSDSRFQIRDSAMADNFIWLKENWYRERKVIVWAANFHTSYCNSCYEPPAFKFKTMGERIKEKYGDRCYSISLTSFANDEPSAPEEAFNNKSIEYLMHQLGYSYLFLDFGTVDTTSFLRGKIIMNCNQNMSFNAFWHKITDGVLFIDTIKRIHPLNEKQ